MAAPYYAGLTPRSRLTKKQVTAIFYDTRLPKKVVAADYGVSTSVVLNIQLRRTWRFVTDALTRGDNPPSPSSLKTVYNDGDGHRSPRPTRR